MGQGNSKETKSPKPENDEALPKDRKYSSASPAVEATPSSFRDGTSPSLSHKLINYFSPKSEELTPKDAPGHLKYSSASPLPPSSSLLATGYRKELGGISPAQHNRVSSSFFLGKVLISPRRPLREGSQLGQDLSTSHSKDVSHELDTPRSLKRKASPENSGFSKKMKHDNTASPSLKPDWKLLSMRAQVEEQDEDEDNETVKPISIEVLSSENLQPSSANTGTIERVVPSNAPVVDVEEQYTVTESENQEECENEAVLYNDRVITADESCLSAPYSPSQPAKNLMSMMNFSLSSSATCESPAPAYVPHNATIEELDEDVADDIPAHQDGEDENNATLSQTIGKGLWLLKETILGADSGSSAFEESASQQKSNEEMFVFDHCEASDDDKSESLADNLPTTPNSEMLENGSTELNGHEAERSSSEARSHCSTDEYEQGINNLPRAGTTHSSTDSRKMLKSEYKVTESKVPPKSDEENSSDKHGYDAGPAKATLRSPSSEDEFYHHPLSRSTFSSSISRGKWPSFSLISTSSVSSIPVASFQFFKSIITSESFSSAIKNSGTEAVTSIAASDVQAATVKDNVADDFILTNDSSPAGVQDNSVELPATNDSTDTSLIPTQDDSENRNLDHDESCELASLPDDSNIEISEDVGNSEMRDMHPERTPDNKNENVNSEIIVATPTTSKPASPKSITPKRSSRIASIRSLQKVIGNKSPVESKTESPSSGGRRRRRRSSSSESSASLHTSQEGQDTVENLSSRSITKKQCLDKPSAAHESNGFATIDSNAKDKEPHKKSSAVKPGCLSMQGKFRDFALLRDDASAQHARDNQLVVVVVRSSSSSSSALIRELRLQFPLGSFIGAAVKHSKKSRRAASHGAGLKQLERSVMQQMSPIIVEAAGSAAMGPYLLIAHSANYTSVVLHEAAFSSMLPYQPARASLPFCYSWFLSLTDSVELNSVGQRLLRQLLAVPVVRRDLLERTKHRSASEFVQSYIRNNTVGGPEILHCTAKGGTSASDVTYSARRDVLRALGQVSKLQVVGFVITPRTFGARVKLGADQLTLWDNSDSPAVPQVITSMFEEQKAHVPAMDDNDPALADDFEDDAADEPNDILGYNADKKSLESVSCDTTESQRLIPTSGLGSRAHITLGCHTRKVHPRTTGFDLLLALQMEKTFNEKKFPNGVVEDPTGFEISDKAEGRENKEGFSQSRDGESQEKATNLDTAENGNGVSEGELPGADADNLTIDDIEEAMSVSIESGGPEVKSTSEQPESAKATPATDCVTVSVDGALVRGYGEGVWVVYPEQYISVSAVFAGFYNVE